MIDWSSWVKRARQFPESLHGLPGEIRIECNVSPPLTDSEADGLADQLPRGLPLVLRQFLTTGSANCACRYVWKPPEWLLSKIHQVFPLNYYICGGANLCDSPEFEYHQFCCQGWAEGFDQFWGPESALDSALMRRSVPFMIISNGDYLALDVETDRENPPVAYLSHEGSGTSRLIAPSFERFAMDWERLSYIGPEIWLLKEWLDKESGMINPESLKTELLRSLLTARHTRD
jgi:hypothetical protein